MRPFLACDWGSTNVRCWRVNASGAVDRHAAFPFGAATLKPGEAPARFAELQAATECEQLPALLCGTIGSTLGWRAAPYCACPASLAEIAGGLLHVAENVQIVPGLACAGAFAASDVMRGEETQIIGWLADAPARSKGRHVLCLPGTHSKWVVVENGAILRFVTAMTGELFALLTAKSSLNALPEDSAEGFEAGLAAAGNGDGLAMRLFSARARVVGDGAEPRSTRSYISGVLIGAECAGAQKHLERKQLIHLIGASKLLDLYQAALQRHGRRCVLHDGEQMALRGLMTIWEQSP